MISGVEGVDPARRQMLIEMLDIDLSWCAACASVCRCSLCWATNLHCTCLHTRRMCTSDQGWCVSCRRLNKVSDGQRRRVQICLGLLRPYEVDAHSHSRQSSRQLPHVLFHITASIILTMLQVLLLDEITVDMDVVGR
jgi:hypothetical protein